MSSQDKLADYRYELELAYFGVDDMQRDQYDCLCLAQCTILFRCMRSKDDSVENHNVASKSRLPSLV